MKRFSLLILTFILILSLCSCQLLSKKIFKQDEQPIDGQSEPIKTDDPNVETPSDNAGEQPQGPGNDETNKDDDAKTDLPDGENDPQNNDQQGTVPGSDSESASGSDPEEEGLSVEQDKPGFGPLHPGTSTRPPLKNNTEAEEEQEPEQEPEA